MSFDAGRAATSPLVRLYRSHLKRAVDVTVAAIALLALSPILGGLAIAIAIKLGRPVIFRQRRAGLGSAAFHVLKFRSMTHEVDADGRLLPDEQRLPAFGEWLRRTSLDELPSLINVLKGEMSLVGPRPLHYDYLELYSPEQARRHEVRPGVTGWAQVNGRNAIGWDQRFALDVWYVDRVSPGLDFTIVLKTVRKVLVSEGISSPTAATMERFMGSAATPVATAKRSTQEQEVATGDESPRPAALPHARRR